MQLYTIRRRSDWSSPDQLKANGERSRQVGDELAAELCWIRTYAVVEDDGTLGSVCAYEATTEEPLRPHAQRARFPADEIAPVADTVVVRRDPGPAPG